MGIVNVTPNSFSDGGRFLVGAEAAKHGRSLAEAGAGILDVGAEASSFFREGVTAVGAQEQIQRLAHVIPSLTTLDGAIVSVDTRSAEVARHAVASGALIINDISAGMHDASMLATVAECGMGIVLMHMGAGYPATPSANDSDIVETVRHFLAARIDAAMVAGIARERIAVDPGVGFGKTMHDNWTLVMKCHELLTLGVPLVLGASRKRFLEFAPPPELMKASEWDALLATFENYHTATEHPRDRASAAVTRIAAKHGVQIHRVHDVTLSAAALRL